MQVRTMKSALGCPAHDNLELSAQQLGDSQAELNTRLQAYAWNLQSFPSLGTPFQVPEHGDDSI